MAQGENKNPSVGAIWKRQTRNGQEMLSMELEIEGIGKVGFVAFKNDFKKEGDKQPDFKVFPRQERGGAPSL